MAASSRSSAFLPLVLGGFAANTWPMETTELSPDVDAQGRAALIARYRDGHAAVIAALEGLDDHALDRRPADGGWTAREVVHHVADSETMAATRLRRLLVEEQPHLAAYDEDEFARRLHYDRDIADALAVIAAVRADTAALLDRLADDDWARAGTHDEVGAYSVDTWLEIYAAHAAEHADQIRQAAAGA